LDVFVLVVVVVRIARGSRPPILRARLGVVLRRSVSLRSVLRRRRVCELVCELQRVDEPCGGIFG